MAKAKLSSQWNVKDGILSIKIEAREVGADGKVDKDAKPSGEFSRSINLAEVLGAGYSTLNEVGQAAIEFGTFTVLRNTTGGAESLDEAMESMDRRLAAFADGNWGAEREGVAIPFTANSLIALAVERATKGAQSAAEAATKLSDLANAACAQNNLGEFAAMEATDRAKVRKAIVDNIKETRPAIAAALAQIEAERAAEAAKRKAEAAAKALGEQGDAEVAGL